MTVVDIFVSDPESSLITNIEFLEDKLGLKYNIQKYTKEQYQEIFAEQFATARTRIDMVNKSFAIYIRLDMTFSAAHAAFLIYHESGHVLQVINNRGLYFNSWASIADPEGFFAGYFAIMEPVVKRSGMEGKVKLDNAAKGSLFPAVRCYANIYADIDVNTWLIREEIFPVSDYIEHLADLAKRWKAGQAEYALASLEAAWQRNSKLARKEKIFSMAGAVFGDSMTELGTRLVKLPPIFNHKDYDQIEYDFIANQKKHLADKLGRFACWDLIDNCWESLKSQDITRIQIDKAFKALSERVTLFVRDFVDKVTV